MSQLFFSRLGNRHAVVRADVLATDPGPLRQRGPVHVVARLPQRAPILLEGGPAKLRPSPRRRQLRRQLRLRRQFGGAGVELQEEGGQLFVVRLAVVVANLSLLCRDREISSNIFFAIAMT